MVDRHSFWAGEELPERNRQDLARNAAAYPGYPAGNWNHTLWVHPRGTDLGGSKSAEELMASYRAAAEPLGYTVKDLRAEAPALVEGLRDLPENLRNPQMLTDIWAFEMRNNGQISVKDSAVYLVQGAYGGGTSDFSARPDEGAQFSGAEEVFDRDFAVPMINSNAAIYYLPVDHVTYSEDDMDNDDAIAEAPQIDIWATWVKPGSEGQEIMRGASESMITRYAKMAEASVAQGDVTMVLGPEQGRFVPGEFSTLASELGKKTNVADPEWALLPGQLAVHSLYDGIAKVDDRSGRSVKQVPDEKWPERTLETGPLGADRTRSLPALNTTKTYEASWKQGREPVNPAAAYYAAQSPGMNPRGQGSSYSPPQTGIPRSPASSNNSGRGR
ncbi:hypothetical protein ACIQNU_35290 [Streptomyces sp. NPDC091292]|uniref:hypothetical protein n=1 Tax=Streptomyces sp. NPDC091292 TaxID=3365991 RepID=UPI003816EBC0